MKVLAKFLTLTVMSGAMLFASTAQAMTIQQFDRMAVKDQAEYVGLLVEGAERVLINDGKRDLAAQVDHLFTTTDPGDAHTIGMVEFERNLARARAADADRIFKNPSAPRLDVEDAMFVTLKKNGIVLPPTFSTVGNTFKPKYSSR